MKANKALKRLAKIERSISNLTTRYAPTAAHAKELLELAKAAVGRAKEAVGLQSSSETAKKTAKKPGAKKAAARKKAAAKKAPAKVTAVKASRKSKVAKRVKKTTVAKKAAAKKAVAPRVSTVAALSQAGIS